MVTPVTTPLDRIRSAKRNPPPGPRGLVNFLAAFSVGLGLYELFGARQLTDTIGLDGREGLVRGYGLRELGAGALTLAAPTLGIASRIGGDLLDLATLAEPARQGKPRRDGAVIAMAAVIGVTALDLVALARLRAA